MLNGQEIITINKEGWNKVADQFLEVKAGFVIDHVVEETRIPDHDNSRPEKWYSAEKARIVPPSFTIKCHKR